MKPVYKSFFILLFICQPAVSLAQNWMMAEKYLTSAIDSLIQINWPNTGKLTGLNISSIGYDNIFDEYTIKFTDTIICSKLDITLKDREAADIVVQNGELIVSLTGGAATYEDENGEVTDLELPDLSDLVIIFNESGREISFSLSRDDNKFEEYTLPAKEPFYYPCATSNIVFIKMVNNLTGKAGENFQCELKKASGYRVIFNVTNSKLEVIPDERIDIEDL